MSNLRAQLGGEANPNSWYFKNIAEEGPLPNPADPVFPIIAQLPSGKWRMVGTGFYVGSMGLFVTARHVIEDAFEGDEQMQPIAVLHLWSASGLFGPQEIIVRPIVQCWLGEQPDTNPVRDPIVHGPAPPELIDVALGVAMPMVRKETGEQLVNSRVALTWATSSVGSSVGTFAFPNQNFDDDSAPRQRISLCPDFYRGQMEAVGERQGRSIPYPFYRVNFRIHGAASGGPVFGPSGHVIGVNTKEMVGSDFAYVARVCCLEGAFIERAAFSPEAPSGRITFDELIKADAIHVEGYVPNPSGVVSNGRIVRLPLLPIPHPLDVDVRVYA